MPIPSADASAIREALHEFDRSLRESDELAGWEQNGAQRYAIEYEGRHYPPKKVISLATQTPVRKFHGGLREANKYLEARGFKIVELRRRATQDPTPLVSFERGRRYSRQRDIHKPFGGSRQSGIAPSRRAPAIFIFTGESGEQFGYKDSFDLNGVFSYTGEGQVGDMVFTRGNLAIRDHAQTGRSIHLFQALPRSEYEYLGEFVYANHSFRVGRDRNGNDRRLIVFHLVPVGLVADFERDTTADDDKQTVVLSLEEARKRALAAFGGEEGSAGRAALRTIYHRSKAVRDYILLRASGKCECCGSSAPFKRKNGTPYLEPHHTTRRSDGGLDHPRFVAALCPTCHREIHYGLGGSEKNHALMLRLERMEAA
jgi:5-methylcytosine-specific restriction enzyme A